MRTNWFRIFSAMTLAMGIPAMGSNLSCPNCHLPDTSLKPTAVSELGDNVADIFNKREGSGIVYPEFPEFKIASESLAPILPPLPKFAPELYFYRDNLWANVFGTTNAIYYYELGSLGANLPPSLMSPAFFPASFVIPTLSI
jgi:hypothetical protein